MSFDYNNTKGLSGFSNFGATCYMNAALQSLCNTKPLLSYIIKQESKILNHLDGNVKNTKNEESFNRREATTKTLTYNLHKIMVQYWKVNCEIRPVKFKKTIDVEMDYFKGGGVQHDTQDFLQNLIDNIHEAVKTNNDNKIVLSEYENKLSNIDMDIHTAKKDNNIDVLRQNMIVKSNMILDNREQYFNACTKQKWKDYLCKGYSVINDIFSGMFIDTFECKTCNYVRYKFDTFNLLTLSIPQKIDENKNEYTLDDLFVYYTQNENLEGKEQYNCEYCCVKRDAIKKSYIHQFPDTLVILIKKWQQHNGTIFKSNIKIKYNHIFNIQPYITQYNQNNTIYELYSVIRHTGGTNGGHYYTYNKNLLNNLWYLHDDGDVFHVDDAEPLNCNGYILFYRKIY